MLHVRAPRHDAAGAAVIATFYPPEPLILPAGWRRAELRSDGHKWIREEGIDAFLSVIVSGCVELDGKRWLHVSVARPERLPSWDDFALVKALFVGTDRYAYQVLPPRAKHVNINPHVLHMWSCLDGEPLPDFTHGGSAL